jgi:hypothetical protein
MRGMRGWQWIKFQTVAIANFSAVQASMGYLQKLPFRCRQH